MPIAGIVALLTSLLPLLPTLEGQISNVIGEVKNKGITPEVDIAIHNLALSVHQQVVDAEKAKLGG